METSSIEPAFQNKTLLDYPLSDNWSTHLLKQGNNPKQKAERKTGKRKNSASKLTSASIQALVLLASHHRAVE